MSRRIDRDQTLLLVVDVQEKLLPVIHDGESVERNIERLIRGCDLLRIPAVVTEQYVKGLGRTTARLRTALESAGGYAPAEKMCFSCFGAGDIAATIREKGRRTVVVAGIEAHVCVHQTVLDLLDAGFDVQVVADAVSSRSPKNRRVALARMTAEGAKLTTTEMLLFELTGTSGTDEFKAISKLVK
jgi:nicotinamidase-related amidase